MPTRKVTRAQTRGRTRKTRRDRYSVMARAIARFLEKQGWNVVLVGGGRITHPIGYPKLKYEFAVDFLGSERARPAARSAAKGAPR